MSTSPRFLCLLTDPSNSITHCLLTMLTSRDMIQLILLNSQFHERVSQTSALANKLFYNKRLQIQKSMYFDFQIDGIDSEQHLKEIIDLIATDSLNFAPEIKALKSLEDQFRANLELYIDPVQSQDHLENLQMVMVEPELPVPGLQRQNIGEHCNTSIQMFFTTESIENSIQSFGEQICQLRIKVVQKVEDIINFFSLENNHGFLKKLRYNPELLMQYTTSNLSLLNIIQLLILIMTVHVNSVKKLLVCLQDSLPTHKIFTEFTLRYLIYRNTICALEEKYGFLFNHFNEAFINQFKEYPAMPRFSLWRTALKIWVKHMEGFHSKNQEAYSELLLIEMQSITEATVTEYISNPESPNNSSTECEFRKSDSLSSEEYSEVSPEQRQSLYVNYQQYLIDVSANQFNIHWCGSSEQKLSGPYSSMESSLLSKFSRYWNHVSNTFSSPIVTKKIVADVTDFLSEKIKPCTFVKIEEQMNECLEDFKKKVFDSDNQLFKQIANSWKQVKVSTSKTDKWIKYLAEQRGLYQEDGDKYKMYFDTSESIDLEDMELQIEAFRKSVKGKEGDNLET